MNVSYGNPAILGCPATAKTYRIWISAFGNHNIKNY